MEIVIWSIAVVSGLNFLLTLMACLAVSKSHGNITAIRRHLQAAKNPVEMKSVN